MWGTTHLTLQHYWLCFNFNPSSRMGTTHWQYGCSQPWNISIHVPIAGNDGGNCYEKQSDFYFNPRSHCRERPICVYRRYTTVVYFNPRSHCRERRKSRGRWVYIDIFQSTFPLQGTTRIVNSGKMFPKNFNPRSHCRERLLTRRIGTLYMSHFNPRSHCRERRYMSPMPMSPYIFQSTFPLQGTTSLKVDKIEFAEISIHVPIAGNDLDISRLLLDQAYFNPRSHCRERRKESTLPA